MQPVGSSPETVNRAGPSAAAKIAAWFNVMFGVALKLRAGKRFASVAVAVGQPHKFACLGN